MKTVKRVIAVFVLLAICFALGYVAYTAKIFDELKEAAIACILEVRPW